jgi:cell division protein FtsW
MTSTLSDRRRATLERQATPAGPVAKKAVERKRKPARKTAARKTAARKTTRRLVLRPFRSSQESISADRQRTLGPPPGTFYVIAGVVAVFVMLGLVMVLSASAVTQSNLGNSPYAVFSRQAIWAGLGLIAMIVVTKVPYTAWRPLTIPLAVLGVLAMAAPFVPGAGVSINGARSWIRLGSISAQPSEFLKLVVVIVAADLLARRGRALAVRRNALLPVAGVATIGAGLCLAQGDLGSAIVIGAIVLSIAWIAGLPVHQIVTMASVAVVGAVLFVVSSPRRLARFTAFTDIEGHKEFESYQVYQGMVSIANGGLTGSGIGGSRTKLGYLPYAHSDFIFSIIADELGMIGTVAVVGGFIVLVAFGIQTALAAPDRFGMLLAGGISAWFGVQAIINLGGVTGVMPVTGLTLPFFSAGGSSLFASMFAAGLLLSVARRAIRT